MHHRDRLRTVCPRKRTLLLFAALKRLLGRLDERHAPLELSVFALPLRRCTDGGAPATLMHYSVHLQFVWMPDTHCFRLFLRDLAHDLLTPLRIL